VKMALLGDTIDRVPRPGVWTSQPRAYQRWLRGFSAHEDEQEQEPEPERPHSSSSAMMLSGGGSTRESSSPEHTVEGAAGLAWWDMGEEDMRQAVERSARAELRQMRLTELHDLAAAEHKAAVAAAATSGDPVQADDAAARDTMLPQQQREQLTQLLLDGAIRRERARRDTATCAPFFRSCCRPARVSEPRHRHTAPTAAGTWTHTGDALTDAGPCAWRPPVPPLPRSWSCPGEEGQPRRCRQQTARSPGPA
jgi:hypothetical protein